MRMATGTSENGKRVLGKRSRKAVRERTIGGGGQWGVNY